MKYLTTRGMAIIFFNAVAWYGLSNNCKIIGYAGIIISAIIALWIMFDDWKKMEQLKKEHLEQRYDINQAYEARLRQIANSFHNEYSYINGITHQGLVRLIDVTMTRDEFREILKRGLFSPNQIEDFKRVGLLNKDYGHNTDKQPNT